MAAEALVRGLGQNQELSDAELAALLPSSCATDLWALPLAALWWKTGPRVPCNNMHAHTAPKEMQGGSRSKAKACACCSRGMMRARHGGRSQKMTAEQQSFKAIRMTPYLLCVCVS